MQGFYWGEQCCHPGAGVGGGLTGGSHGDGEKECDLKHVLEAEFHRCS